MIKAELSYNPYLLETKIKFNGKEPRINSQVEKYIDGSLQKWVKKIPQIFHDEMNGYDFELEFTGTKSDFVEVEKAFLEAGISSKEVRLFHINEMDDRDQKALLIDELLRWLQIYSPKRYFDYESFKEDHYDLFDGSYPYILIQGNNISTDVFEQTDISPENINQIEEINSTNLTNTPVLFYITRDNLRQFQNNLRAIIGRRDVTKEQLFFLMHPSINASIAERIIQDLGVEKPQIVSGIYSDEVRKFMELYPVTDYIYRSIKILRNTALPIEATLKEKREVSNRKNRDINQKIEELEARIANLKTALDKFENKDNIPLPDSWVQKKDAFLDTLRTWRDRKTKITKDDEAIKVALELDIDLIKHYRSFLSSIKLDVEETVDNIIKIYGIWYQDGGYDTEFSSNQSLAEYQTPDMPSVRNKLLNIKNEEYVQAKEAIFAHFFKGAGDPQNDKVLEITYSYQEWREYVVSVAEPIVERVLQDYYQRLTEMGEMMAKDYIEHLEQLIHEQTEERNQTASKLSKEEQVLQEDINWITEFCEKLRKIER